MNNEKGKMKNGLILLALISSIVFLGCQNPFNQPKQEKPEAGKGYFSLSIDGASTAKTIMPFGAGDFVGFTVEFENVNKSELSFTLEDLTYETLSTPVLLDGGIWNVYVSAYLEIEGELNLAARGTLAGIEIGPGKTINGSVALNPITDGEGTFRWDIDYPAEVTTATMTITPIIANGMDEQVLYFIGGTPLIDKAGDDACLTLNSGYYRVMFRLRIGNTYAERRETLHVYNDMESVFDFEFEAEHFYDNVLLVTTRTNTGTGSLRWAITNVPTGGRIIVNPNVKTIALTARLDIDKSMTIEGNGVTITRATSWTATDMETQLMGVNNADAEVTIRRAWFKDGRTTSRGGAIYIANGTVTIESCIFSGNQTSPSSAAGGAIHKVGRGTLNVKSSTFYNNRAQTGGAIYNGGDVSKLTFTGNLFYGNISTSYDYAIYANSGNGAEGTVISGGYNISDTTLAYSRYGYPRNDNDKPISDLPVSLLTFRLIPGSGAAGVLTTLPEDYPTEDFYGNTITNGAAAGAVQGSTASGYYLDLSVSNSAAGGLSVTPPLDADGIATANEVTVTADSPDGYELRWLVDGTRTAGTGDKTLELTLTNHTFVHAAFSWVFLVTDFSDASGSASVEGRLRHALTNANDGDTIRLDGVTAGESVIRLTSRLPSIEKSITIEGNGVTITKDASWTATGGESQLMNMDNLDAEATISRVHFKDGSSWNSGAISKGSGILTLESCIFSGNRTTAYSGAGAIQMAREDGTLNVKGCTFYNNSTPNGGGAISNNMGTLTLTGNLFYGNTFNARPSAVSANNAINLSTTISNGYNVADTDVVTMSGGWNGAASTDKTINNPLVLPTSFRILPGGGADNVITTRPAGYPDVDFYGYPITIPASAGAVQSKTNGNGYYLLLSVNNSARGSLETSPSYPDNFYNNEVTVTATPAADNTVKWFVNGVETDGSGDGNNTLQLTLTKHTSVQAVFIGEFRVTNFTDVNNTTTQGTLRYAVARAIDGDTIHLDGVEPGKTTINLLSRLPQITKGITIEGNGVILTRSWDTGRYGSQLMSIDTSSGEVTIRRVWFKDGASESFGGAIQASSGTLTLESCIFSGNYSNSGGAIYVGNTTLNVRGCTFYANTSASGGAFYTNGSDGTVTLTGNLFYGNKAIYNTQGHVVYRAYGTVTSNGYNVVDVALGASNTQSGFAAHANDQSTSVLPVSGASFRLLFGSPAANVIAELPEDYPTEDFYGNPITDNAAAGAVQGTASGSGYYLDLSVNRYAYRNISTTEPNADGLYSGTVTITATAPAEGYTMKWLVDGIQTPGTEANTLQLTLTKHTFVQAFYFREWHVTSTANAGAGSLRQAINDAQDGDVIILDGVTAGQTVIELEDYRLQIEKSITIEGNGVILTKAPTWTTENNNSQLMYINYNQTNVTIRGVWFKDGRATDYGAAIFMQSGTVTLESCIFSGNRTTAASSYGGAICIGAAGTEVARLNVNGCTFYDNSAGNGGAIGPRIGTSILTLTGNLFYGNTADRSSVVGISGTRTSNGYNVVDVDFGGNYVQSGFTAAPGDKTIADIWVSNTTSPFANATTLAPKSELSIIPTATWTVGTGATATTASMPTTDFYGEERTWPGAMGAVR